ncbi:hypothetical protein B0H13DRAFT_2654257 [Mycena leptocephala]|nr:hypothetical protein B0H13DRAFT_2654257 [Mycena leptocephala]
MINSEDLDDTLHLVHNSPAPCDPQSTDLHNPRSKSQMEGDPPAFAFWNDAVERPASIESQTEESLGTRPVTTRIALRPPGGLRRPSRPTGVPRAAGIHPAHGNIQPNLTPPPTPIPPHRLRCTSPARCHLAHGFRCRHIHLTHGARLSVIPHPLHPARDTRTAHLHRRRSLSGNPPPRRDISLASRVRPIRIAPRSMGKGSAPRGFARVITSTSHLPDVDPSSPPINEENKDQRHSPERQRSSTRTARVSPLSSRTCCIELQMPAPRISTAGAAPAESTSAARHQLRISGASHSHRATEYGEGQRAMRIRPRHHQHLPSPRRRSFIPAKERESRPADASCHRGPRPRETELGAHTSTSLPMSVSAASSHGHPTGATPASYARTTHLHRRRTSIHSALLQRHSTSRVPHIRDR